MREGGFKIVVQEMIAISSDACYQILSCAHV